MATCQPTYVRPGDSLIFEFDAAIFDNAENENPKGEYFARVTGGNRVKDNADLRAFLKGRPDKFFTREYHDQAIVNKSAHEYSFYIQEREDTYNKYLNEFKKINCTTQFFNQWADDYLKYESWTDLMDYPRKHDSYDKVQRDEVIVSKDYYNFLNKYDMNDNLIFTTKHAEFLNQYSRYVLSHPKDSIEKAHKLFKEKGINTRS